MQDIKHYKPFKETIKAFAEFQENFPQNDIYKDNNILFEYVNLNFVIVKTAFYKEYNKFYDTEYFLGCSFKMYEKTYYNRLNDFTLFFPDSDEINFINNELSQGIFRHKFQNMFSDYIENLELQVDLIIEQKIVFSLGKRFGFLKNRAELLGFDLLLDGYDVENKKEQHTLKRIKNFAEKKEETQVENKETDKPINKHPEFFIDGAFEIFDKWMQSAEEKDLHKKISFIIQKLKEQKKMRNTNFKDLTNWFVSNNYIDEKTEKEFRIIESFVGSSKILTKGRNNIFNIMFIL